MTKLLIVPDGWPCTLEECPPGPFVTLDNPNLLCFKSEYSQPPAHKYPMALNSAGEFFSGEGRVQPVEMIEESDD